MGQISREDLFHNRQLKFNLSRKILSKVFRSQWCHYYGCQTGQISNACMIIQGEEPKLTILFPIQTNIQTQEQIHRQWYNIKLYGVSYVMGQFGVDQTENGFTSPKKAESGWYALCKSEGKEHFWHVGVSLKTVYNIKKAMTTEDVINRKSGSCGSNKKKILYFMMP